MNKSAMPLKRSRRFVCRTTLSLSEGATALVHSKSHDDNPIPIILEVIPKAYSDFGIDQPPQGRMIDINRGWKRSEDSCNEFQDGPMASPRFLA